MAVGSTRPPGTPGTRPPAPTQESASARFRTLSARAALSACQGKRLCPLPTARVARRRWVGKVGLLWPSPLLPFPEVLEPRGGAGTELEQRLATLTGDPQVVASVDGDSRDPA